MDKLNMMDLLNTWAEVVGYDDKQTSFNMLSSNYLFHEAGKRIKQVLDYDSSGTIAGLYAKFSFESILKELKFSLYDYCNSPSSLADYLQLWDKFHHPDLIKLEKEMIAKLKTSDSPTDILMIGGCAEDTYTEEEVHLADMNEFRDGLEDVVDELRKLHVDVFKNAKTPIAKSEDIQFVSKLFVFNTIAECLLALESNSGENMLYLCYIADNNGGGGHFMFVIKSNGNMIGFSDRVDETYVGQHQHSRNGRWMEGKSFEVFPYEEVMEFEGTDYKGYPKRMKAITTGLDIRELKSRFVYRIMLAAILVISKYANSEEHCSKPTLYTHSLVSAGMMLDSIRYENVDTQLVLSSGTQVIDLRNSEVVNAHRQLIEEFNATFTSENVKSGELTEKFDSIKYAHYTTFNQDSVDLYSEGFEINPHSIMAFNTKLIPSYDTESEEYEQLANTSTVSEYVADAEHIELEMYRQYRKQLAEYVQGKMDEEFAKLGGRSSIRKWYKQHLIDNKDRLIELAVKFYAQIENGERANRPVDWYGIPITKEIVVGYVKNENAYWTRSGQEFILNTHQCGDRPLQYRCPISGCTANIWVEIQPCVLDNIIELLGPDVEIPNIMKGWANTSSNNGGLYTGNHILDNCDPVSRLRHPLVDGDDRFDFSFTIGLSKKGINTILKKLGITITKKS